MPGTSISFSRPFANGWNGAHASAQAEIAALRAASCGVPCAGGRTCSLRTNCFCCPPRPLPASRPAPITARRVRVCCATPRRSAWPACRSSRFPAQQAACNWPRLAATMRLCWSWPRNSARDEKSQFRLPACVIRFIARSSMLLRGQRLRLTDFSLSPHSFLPLCLLFTLGGCRRPMSPPPEQRISPRCGCSSTGIRSRSMAASTPPLLGLLQGRRPRCHAAAVAAIWQRGPAWFPPAKQTSVSARATRFWSGIQTACLWLRWRPPCSTTRRQSWCTRIRPSTISRILKATPSPRRQAPPGSST